ncbi:MAG: SCO family protein, partial [Methyloligellaceae bacterium]
MSVPGIKTALAVLGFLLAVISFAYPGPRLVHAGERSQSIPAATSFSLVDHRGKPVTEKNFRGKFMLVFFGYTYCPDVCPTGLQTMSTALESLGHVGDKIIPVFVTVDPERDSAEVMAAYVTHFHSRLIGLTGTRQQTAQAARVFGVRNFKVFFPPFENEDNSANEQDKDEDENSNYLLNHSANTYLVGPDGRVLTIFPFEASPGEIEQTIRKLIEA